MRLGWRVGFLAVTGLAIGAECWAAWDGDPRTDPWTELVVRYVPWEVLVAAGGALAVWLPAHFWRRYRRRRMARPMSTAR